MAKKQKCPEFENHERWLISFADMLTLLFAVFVVLYALSISSESKNEQVAGSMQESFNAPLDDVPIDRRIGPTEAGYGIFEHLRGDSARPPISKKYPGSSESVKTIDGEFNKIKLELENRLYGPNKFNGSNKPGEQRVVEVQRTANGFKLKLLARYFYEPGGIKVRREAMKELDEVIAMLKELGRPITIEGHTDSMPAPGEYSNWDLSALRATQILQYMIREHNYPATMLGAVGYADTRPIAHNGTAAGRALNRRIEIQVNYNPVDAPDAE